MLNTLDRRSRVLKCQAIGFSTSEILQTVAKEFNCSKETVYRDIRLRHIWQPKVQECENYLLTAINRAEFIYRESMYKFHTSLNECAKASFLKIALQANQYLAELMGCTPQPITAKEIVLRWATKEEIEKWNEA